jgi:predicted esterase
MLEPRWCVFTSQLNPTSCILILPGRDQTGIELAHAWARPYLPETMIVTVTPVERQWYPQPYSSTDQANAVAGLAEARQIIEEVVDKIEKDYNIPRHRIALAGFSAGGVMGINVAAHSDKEFAAVVCHAGAILEPQALPLAKFPEMPIVLTHCKDDGVFDWDERFLPMVEALDREGYNYFTIESEYGGHSLNFDDISESAEIIAARLGYEDVSEKHLYFDL